MSQEEKQVNPAEFHGLVRDVGEMKSLMSQIADAITRITVLDERQQVVTGYMQKLDDRMERMELRQHKADVDNALVQGNANRLASMEAGFREMYLDRERDKARFHAVVWMVRALWAVSGAGVLAMAGVLFRMTTGG